MEQVEQGNFKRWLLTLPWALLRFFGRIVRRFFVAVGVLVALAVVGYVEFESIVETIDAHLREGTGRASTETEKIGDIIVAVRIEREFSRPELLLKYVNMPYFGRGQYGIEAASRAYFGKPAKDLALHQAAFIVALINK